MLVVMAAASGVVLPSPSTLDNFSLKCFLVTAAGHVAVLVKDMGQA